MIRILVLLVFFLSTLSSLPLQAQKSKPVDPAAVLKYLQKIEDGFKRVSGKVRQSTISIENWRQVSKDGPARMTSGGSGVIIDTKGHALTNQHVVAKAAKLVCVLYDGRRVPATVVGRDNRGDTVVIRLDKRKLKGRLPHTRLNVNAVKALEPGDLVIATGNPFFLARDGDPVVTMGVVSGLGRVSGGEYTYGNAIQHDARINPGNSGGPLWDVNGNLVGINGRISSNRTTSPKGPSSNGVGYAIPISQIKNFLAQMLEGEENVAHGDTLFGVEVDTAVDDGGRQYGALVTKVKPGSPAANAKAWGTRKQGFLTGDVICSISHKGTLHKIKNKKDYMNIMSPIPGGARLRINIKRGTRKLTFNRVTLPNSKNEKNKKKARR